ncbi:biopolymer transporter ExbD [Halarcobacter sp.]|uniref:ExbD/TolR family protein n=1 Tax=Halarcobacter sp. TaxID=2321133 RepID=UPI002AA932FC|nr:biopolymer transporter ExbD [Halarcobacter sp.]
MKIKKFDSINVIPFIDIMLVLLVIILTTASFVAKGMIPVDLPEASSAKTIENKKSITITVKENGEILFEKNHIDRSDFEKRLITYEKKTPIQINCDKNVKFENFIFLLDILKNNNYENIGIITKKEKLN